MEIEAERSDFMDRWPTPGHMAVDLAPRTRQTPALEAIDRELTRLANGELKRLMIFMAPQEGKSQRVSCWYVLWRLALDPTLRIGIVSYASNKAERWGRWLRRMIRSHPELGIQLMPDSRASDRFETTAGGQVISVGIAGGITGEPVDEMVIDDPVRGRAEAESSAFREHAWEWWESNGATRLSDRGRVVLMMTRWHADDLAGRLLANEPNEWHVLRIPAIREEGIEVRGSDGASAWDPNGELISTRQRGPSYFRDLRAKRSAYVWRSVYAQNPVLAEGNLFRRGDFRYWTHKGYDRTRHGPLRGERVFLDSLESTVYLDDCWRFVTIDLAATKKTSADWTVASVWAITPNGDLVLLERLRERMEENAHWVLVKPLTTRWKALDVFVERGFIGTTLVVEATRAGCRVLPMDVETDKLTRALPATHRVRSHSVFFPGGADWLDDWCDELAAFPSGRHDDQVDTLSGAVRIVAAHWVPQGTTADRRATGDRVDGVEWEAFLAATGASEPLDLGDY